MGRPAKLGRSTVLAVRVPEELAEQIYRRCGGQEKFAEWCRNWLRQACGIPLDKRAGYDEGFSAGWTDANARFRDALKKSA